MIDPAKPSDHLTELANAAFVKASKQVIQLARQTNTPVVVWEDGQVRHLTPDEAALRLHRDEAWAQKQSER